MKKAAVTVVVVAYAWWAAGAAPFHPLSYVLVGIPSAGMIWAYAAMGGLAPSRAGLTRYYRRRSGGATLKTVTPWILVLLAVLILETVGLALGGRSRSVPTLSTMVDYLLSQRWERSILYAAWLMVGGVPVLRLWRLRRREGT
jgi:hypothetical protein